MGSRVVKRAYRYRFYPTSLQAQQLAREEFGLRLSRDGLVMRVVDQVMNSELPTPHSGVTQSSPIPQPILIVKPAE